MEAAPPTGDLGGGGGGDGAGGDAGGITMSGAGFVSFGADCSESSNPAAAVTISPSKSLAADQEQSHRNTSVLGGVDLDDELWDVRFKLENRGNLERSLCKSDITYMNMLALIESEGYGIMDSVYYVKEEGRGTAGMELIDGMAKVKKMVEQYEHKRVLNLLVMKGKSLPFPYINSPAIEQQTDDSDMLYMFTQESNNIKQFVPTVAVEEEDQYMTQQSKLKGKQSADIVSEDEEDEYGGVQYEMDEGPEVEEAIRKEDADLSQKIIDMKRKRSDPVAPAPAAAPAPRAATSAEDPARVPTTAGARSHFTAPRINDTGVGGRPIRQRKESSRIKGYFTASGIDKMTLADIKKDMQ